MRYLACFAALATLVGCYLAPDKSDDNGLSQAPGFANADGGNGLSVPSSGDASGASTACTSSDTCPADAPACMGNACVGCTAHDQCTRFAATPACGPQGTCVPCTTDEVRACPAAAPTCDPSANQCVQCVNDTRCGDPQRSACNATAHTCEPCSASDDCAHIPGKHVCSEGACVECTRGNISACSESVVGEAPPIQFVCNPVSHTCDRTRAARSKQTCENCVSDLECSSGNVCVDVPAGAGNRVCQQVRTTAACPRPYVSASLQSVLTADGEERVIVCTFGLDTTCEAHRHYRNQRCGTPIAPGATQDIEGSGNNARCGAAGRDDGFCIWHSALRQHLCTVHCNNNVVDCPVDAATCSVQIYAGQMSRNLCSF